MAYEGRFRKEDKGPKVNNAIREREVRLIDDEGKMLGVVSTHEALSIAAEKGLDLVEVDPNSRPVVAKIVDYGKYKYELKKKMQEAKKKQIVVDIKEVQFRPNIDKHDFDFKVRNIERFIEDGDKVRVCIVFRGREIANQALGQSLVSRIKETTAPYAMVEAEPKFEGRKMIMQLAPLKLLK